MFTCDYCNKGFTTKFNLKNHIVRRCCLRKLLRCLICETYCISPAALRKHCRKYHSNSDSKPVKKIKSEVKPIKFSNMAEFLSWKENMEHLTVSRFVKSWGLKLLKNGNKTISFHCHRSGMARVKTDGRKRAPFRKGSCKINDRCSAYITIQEKTDGSIEGVFCDIHCNHKNEMKYLTLTENERRSFAEQLSKGVSLDHILDSIRSNVELNSGSLRRSDFITKKDLHNIKDLYQISFRERFAEDDLTSVHLMVEHYRKRFGDLTPIKLCKYQNDDVIDGLDQKDSIIIIMTRAQKQILKQFGHNIICVDSPHGTNGWEFILTTVFVLDDFNMGIPAAFCLCNREDENSMEVFFQTIKKECGIMNTSTFMSDDFPAYFSAWTKVMGTPGRILLFTGYVDKNWRQNIVRMITANPRSNEVRNDVYKTLRTLLVEMDEKLFPKMLQSCVSHLLQKEKTRKFGLYFEKKYARKPEKWAYVYRKNAGIDTNIKIEAIHRVLKDVYFEGFKVKRLDSIIFQLLRLARDKSFKEITNLTLEKDIHALKAIQDCHKQAQNIKVEDIIRTGDASFEVKSQSDISWNHSVIKETVECTCTLKCFDCDICIHNYSCSCIDKCINGNICKHIHAVNLLYKNYTILDNSINEMSGTEEEVNNFIQVIQDPEFERQYSENVCCNYEKKVKDALQQMKYLIMNETYDSKVYKELLEVPIIKGLQILRENSQKKVLLEPWNTKYENQ